MSLERYNPSKISGGSPIEKEIKKRALPSWETVDGMLELRTSNDHVKHAHYQKYRTDLRHYYDVVYEKTINPNSDTEIPLLPTASIAYHFRIVRETIHGAPEKFSKGYKKAVRKAKAEQRKTSK